MERKISNIKERILYFTDIQGIVKEIFFEKIGMTYGNFKGIQKKSALNSDAIARILSFYPEINPTWLLTGQGKMLLEETPPNDQESTTGSMLSEEYKNALKQNGKLEYQLEEAQERIKELERTIERLKKGSDVVGREELKK